MLETIRDFGLAQLQEMGRTMRRVIVTRRISMPSSRASISTTPCRRRRLVRAVAREEANLRRALTRFADRGHACALNDLSAALDVYWLTRAPSRGNAFWLDRPSPVMPGCRHRPGPHPGTRAHVASG